jgi:RIO kinase 1
VHGELSLVEDTLEKLEQKKIDFRKFRLKRTDDLKSIEGVIDQSTLFTLNNLMNRGLFRVIHGVVATGKEANVYWAENTDGESFALKIYRTSTADFRRMREYVIGDPRFKRIRRGIRSMVFTWAEKEFKNLKIAIEVGVRVPKPIAVEKNILVMEFIGENGVPAPRLRDISLKSPLRTYKRVLRFVKLLYRKGQIVHADLSEYNILMHRGPVVIDISQAVHISHPLSRYYLKRDIENIVKFFSSLAVVPEDVPTVYEAITGEEYSLERAPRSN